MHSECECRGAAISLVQCDIIDRQRRRHIVIRDCALTLIVEDGGIRRVRQINEESLVRFIKRVTFHLYGHRNRSYARGKAKRRCRYRRVIRGRSRATIRRCVIYCNGRGAGRRQ